MLKEINGRCSLRKSCPQMNSQIIGACVVMVLSTAAGMSVRFEMCLLNCNNTAGGEGLHHLYNVFMYIPESDVATVAIIINNLNIMQEKRIADRLLGNLTFGRMSWLETNTTMMENDFDAEKFSDVTKNIHLLKPSMIAKMIGAAKQHAQSMIGTGDHLLKLISFIDLTSLNSDDTDNVIERLIDKAVLPYPTKPGTRCAAVCAYPARISGAKRISSFPLFHTIIYDILKYFALSYSYVTNTSRHMICANSMAAGFPSGQYRIESKILEVKLAVEDGANEIDIVISRDAANEQDWKRVYDEVAALKACCGSNCMKTILATGELQTNEDIYRASWAAMLAGSDFIKTSTGKEKVNATYKDAYIMCQAIKQFYSLTGKKVGFKAAGGIKSTLEALGYQVMVEKILGEEWLEPNLFRIGASSLLNDIINELNKI
uniref:deoxyribose-phosphate aldolase n=1 Tax=Wuchereria bancrofti TaxID=6293 RepID=A0A1I8EPU4_WUCBA